MVVDYSECFCANVYSDGEIKTLFSDKSLIPNKQDAGGQSAKRYQRNRELAIVHWFKDINEKLKSVNQEIYVGISSIYYNRFLNYLSTYNKQKIKERVNSEYSDLSGIYQMIKKLDNRVKTKSFI